MRSLNHDGFVLSYLSAITEEDYDSPLSDRNQLKLEARLRKNVSERKSPELGNIDYSELSPYYSHGNIFVDRSSFYSTLNRIRMIAATTLVSDREMDTEAVLWTYMATGVYVNGSLAAETEHPVYKPIESKKFHIHLKEGRNDIVFLSDNLGVRDTRNMLAFQILRGTEHITTTIPDEAREAEYSEYSEFLDGVEIGDGTLVFPSAAPKGTILSYSPETIDFTKLEVLRKRVDISGKSDVTIPEGIEHCSLILPGGMTRRFEFERRINPHFLPIRDTWKEHFADIMKEIADTELLDRGEHGFAVFTLLARKYLGIEKGNEKELILNDLSLINKRFDCSDFLMCGLLRYIHEYGLPEDLKAEAKNAILNYRYWMTMKGADGMCFWSENHSLMFWFSACDAGLMYPDELFPRTGMTGKELHEYGERRVDEWLDDVLSHGYEEFLSSTYMSVTLAVLLNVIDYTKPEISEKARKAVDRILEMLSISTFKGAVIAPMGRVYRGVIHPYNECVAAWINAIDETAPHAYGEGWLSFLASSSYTFPEGLKKLMDENISTKYSTGNALVSVEKNESYILTAVESPREDEGFVRWRNSFNDENVDAENNLFVKSLNECFHGTSCFQPGVYGYQQHMWSAALSAEAVVFANHPGTTSEEAELRPGYWNGNGIMPAIKTGQGEISVIYSIPENHPISFTHLYLPQHRFSSVIFSGNWIFLSAGEGYLAIWVSGKLVPYSDMMATSELRLYSRASAYYVRAGKKSDESFESFMDRMKKLNVEFSEEKLELSVNGIMKVKFIAVNDKTQYLD